MTASIWAGGTPKNAYVRGTLMAQEYTATAAQALFTLTEFAYTVNTQSIMVFIDGLKTRNFTETSSTSITLDVPLGGGEVVEIVGFPELDLQATTIGSVIYGGTQTLESYLAVAYDAFNAKAYPWLATGDGTTDDYAAINQCAVDAAGMPVHLPEGVYRLNTQLARVTTSLDVFAPGLILIGDGSSKTIIDSRVANAAAIKIDTDAVTPNARFQRNVQFRGMTITGSYGSPTNGSGVYLRHAYNVLFDDTYIKNFQRDGVYVEILEGDTDGSNGVIFWRSRIQSCNRWGINAESVSGANEFGFLQFMGNSSISGCGTGYAFDAYSGTGPTSGGVKWKGNGATFRDGYITECPNCALYIQGGSGLGLLFSMEAFTLENNGWQTANAASTGAQVYCTGLRGGVFQNIDMRNNEAYRAKVGFMFDSSVGPYTIAGIDIEHVQIQATASNNPYTLFDARGNAGTDISITKTDYRLFDLTGQTRFGSGLFAGFSQIRIEDGGKEVFSCDNVLETTYTSANPTYLPNVARYGVHSIILNAGTTGTLTFGALATESLSSIALQGRGVDFIVYNNSGGSISLASSGMPTRSMPGSIANGATLAARFRYRTGTTGWSQVGAWG